jgi:predicted dehydrogenase
MITKKIKWGILGTGFISGVMAKAIQDSTYGELVAIASRSVEKANAFAAQYAVPKTYTDQLLMLQDPDIDVIYIALPNHLHKEWIINCAQAGKHILCEKPFTTTSEDAITAFDATKNANVFCMEALMYRCHPLIHKLTEIIQSKIIGDVKHITAAYMANIVAFANPTAGGSIYDIGCYPLSLIRVIAGATQNKVFAEPIEMIGLGTMNAEKKNDINASVILKFADNVTATITCAVDIGFFSQLDIFGTQGHLKLLTNPWLPDKEDNQIALYKNSQPTPEIITVAAPKALYTHQIDVVNSQIMNSKVNIGFEVISPEETLGNVQVIEQWLQQIKKMEKI